MEDQDEQRRFSVIASLLIANLGSLMKIMLAADHAGFPLKQRILNHLRSEGYIVEDLGTDSEEPVDYPDVIRPAAERVASGEFDCGVIFGGSGNGEAIVANKVHGIRCAVCWNVPGAALAREHNNANIISLGARLVDHGEAPAIVDAWLHAAFEGGRHERRIRKIER